MSSEIAPLQFPPPEETFRREKLVAHFKDGIISRGFSRDFDAERDTFHLLSWDGDIGSTRRIHRESLKALFHVKTWGTPGGHGDRRKEFPSAPPTDASTLPRTIVEFFDGEEIWGYCRGYESQAPAFFLLPADPHDNNASVFVIRSSLVKIQFLDH